MTGREPAKPLEENQTSLLREVLAKRAPDLLVSLFPRAKANALARDERQRLCELVGAEIAETGLAADSEPLRRGLRLEELLDSINRPKLFPGPAPLPPANVP